MGTSEKTITCIPFLNKRLKPMLFEGGNEAYPIYIRVIYESKNTHIPLYSVYILQSADTDPSHFYAPEEDYYDILDDIEHYDEYIIDPDKGVNILAEEIKYALKILKDIIKLEISIKPNRYSLNGLGKRLNVFEHTILEDRSKQIVTSLKDYLTEAYQGAWQSYIITSQDVVNNYNNISELIHERHIRLPEQIQTQLEYYYLVGACFNARYGPTYGKLLLFNGMNKFEDFLNKGSLFDSDEVLKVPLWNRFSRLLSLNPPRQSKQLYISMLNDDMDKLKKKHLELLG
ncbi:MAG: hypothetical protein HRU12_16780 [Phaeodactylibacter sp.]|nr:hypothetical protein [Phaeodactylibacter sp.]